MKPETYCRRHGLTQSQFGKLVGLDKATISRLFNGIPISIKNAIKIELKTSGAVTRADVRPDLRPLSRKERRSLRQSSPIPETVSETETSQVPQTDA